jgi:hypothetical protein
LRGAVKDDAPVREAALFGYTNHYLNVTDGRHVYMRANDPDYTGPVWDYTLDPANMNRRYDLEKLRTAEPVAPLSFSKGVPLLRYASEPLHEITSPRGTLLYDLQQDPAQENSLDDAEVESRMTDQAKRLMAEIDAPAEQYARLGWAASS